MSNLMKEFNILIQVLFVTGYGETIEFQAILLT